MEEAMDVDAKEGAPIIATTPTEAELEVAQVPAVPQVPVVSSWRVKLYQLEAEGVWQDLGTGDVCCSSEEGYPMVVVWHEDKQRTLLKSKVQSDDIYERQGESIILWREPSSSSSSGASACVGGGAGPSTSTDIDYALSFQETAGCAAIWIAIVDAQKLVRPRSVLFLGGNGSTSCSSNSLGGSGSPLAAGGAGGARNVDGWVREGGGLGKGLGGGGAPPQLPVPSESTISEIRDKLASMHISHRDVYAFLVQENDGAFLRQLLAVFGRLEDMEDAEALPKIAEICRSLMLLNDAAVIELLVCDDVFVQVAGAMEYDPVLKKDKVEFRNLLAKAKMKEVPGAPMEDPVLVSAVQRLFKLKFLKDSLLRPGMEEGGALAVENMVMVATSEVCGLTFEDHTLLLRVFHTIDQDLGITPQQRKQSAAPRKDEHSEESREESAEHQPFLSSSAPSSTARAEARFLGLKFVRELFYLSRTLQFARRVDLYEKFACANLHVPFFTLCFNTLTNHDAISAERILVSEMLTCLVVVSPSLLRQIIVQGPVPTAPPYMFAASASQVGQVARNNNGNSSVSMEKVQADWDKNKKCFLWVIITKLISDNETTVIEQLVDAVRVLIDTDRFERLDKDKFLGLFYDHYIPWMLVPFADEPESSQTANSTSSIPSSFPFAGSSSYTSTFARSDYSSSISPFFSAQPQNLTALWTSRRLLVELLNMCVSSHSYRMKYYMMRNATIARVCRLLECPYKHLHLSAIRFIRTVIAAKDEFYFRHIIKQDLLRPVLNILKKSRNDGDNLLSSAVLELVELIRTESFRTLLDYIVEQLADCFVVPLHVIIFENLRLKYDQYRDPHSSFGVSLSGSSNGTETSSNDFNRTAAVVHLQLARHRQQMERDSEEAYFFDEDGNNDVSSSSSSDAFPSTSSSSSLSHRNAIGPSPLAHIATYGDEEEGETEDRKDEKGSGSSEVGSLCETGMGKAFLKGTSTSPPRKDHDEVKENAEEDDVAPPLPPLRPKFEVDDEESNSFFVRAANRQKETDNSSSSTSIYKGGGGGGGGGSIGAIPTTTTTAPIAIASAGTLSFAIQKRPRLY